MIRSILATGRNFFVLACVLSGAWLTAGVNVWSGNGPFGATISGLCCDPALPGVVYAGTWEKGVFKSTDGGESWFSASDPALDDDYVIQLDMDSESHQILYANTEYSGLFKTTDGGGHWSWLGYSPWDWAESLTAHPYQRNELFVGSPYNLYHSTDGGSTWEVLGSFQSVRCMAFDPEDHLSYYVGTWDDGIFKTTDGGLSWAHADSGLPNDPVTALVTTTTPIGSLYCAAGWSVYKSTDRGQNWNLSQELSSTAEIAQLIADPVTPGRVYASTTGAGYFRTDDGGSLWTQHNSGLGDFKLSRMALSPDSGERLYVGAFGTGVYCSLDQGDHWIPANRGLNGCIVNAIAYDPGDPLRVYAGCWGAGLYISENGGEDWSAVPNRLSGLLVNCLAVDPVNAGVLYAGTSGSGLLVSTDRGLQWTRADQSLNHYFIRCLAIDPQNPHTVYVGCDDHGSQAGGIFRTTTGGASWERIVSSGSVYGLVIDPYDSATLMACFSGEGLRRSRNHGDSWDYVSDPVDDPFVPALNYNPFRQGELFAGYYGYGLFRSTDGGESWNQVDDGLDKVYDIAISPADPALICASGIGGIRLSRDGGMTWASAHAGLPDLEISSLAGDPGGEVRFLAGSGFHGVLELRITADLNQDGRVDAVDLLLLKQFLAANVPSLPAGPQAADINLDGRSDILDAMVMGRMLTED